MIVWFPAASELVVNCAHPHTDAMTDVPIGVAPLSTKNSTDPVGVAPVPTALTVAVNVTDCPITDGFGVELTDMAVSAINTVWVNGRLVEPVKLLSPP